MQLASFILALLGRYGLDRQTNCRIGASAESVSDAFNMDMGS